MTPRRALGSMRPFLLATALLLLSPTLTAHAGTTAFFLGSGDTLTADPQPSSPNPLADVRTETFDGPFFVAATEPLAAPMRITRAGDAFELHLEDREKLQPTTDYRTVVRVLLEDEDGRLVRDAHGSIYYLGDEVALSPGSSLQDFRVIAFGVNASGPLASDAAAVIVPAGLRLVLEFGLRSEAGAFDLGALYHDVLETGYGAAIGAADSAVGASPLAPSGEPIWTRLRDETLASATAGVRNNPTLDNAVRGAYVPASTFQVRGDHPDASRLAVHLG